MSVNPLNKGTAICIPDNTSQNGAVFACFPLNRSPSKQKKLWMPSKSMPQTAPELIWAYRPHSFHPLGQTGSKPRRSFPMLSSDPSFSGNQQTRRSGSGVGKERWQAIWVWVKHSYPKWNPGTWTQELEPAAHILVVSFDP